MEIVSITPPGRGGGFAWLRHIAVAVAALSSGAAFAQARPVAVYEGTIGVAPVELLLVHDSQQDGLGGLLVDRATGVPVDLEKTPFRTGEAPMINVLGDPALPGATLVFGPLDHPSPRRLRGEHVDLRTRAVQPMVLERTALFSSDVRVGYGGELLQPLAAGPWEFRVHARKVAGEHGGRVDQIRVVERASGETVQVIEGIELVFRGLETLRFGYFDDDDRIDFHVQAVVEAAPGGSLPATRTHYYLHDAAAGGYRRPADLESLAARGAVTFTGKGWFEFRPRSAVDYSAGVLELHRYRLVSPEQLELRDVRREAF